MLRRPRPSDGGRVSRHNGIEDARSLAGAPRACQDSTLSLGQARGLECPALKAAQSEQAGRGESRRVDRHVVDGRGGMV